MAGIDPGDPDTVHGMEAVRRLARERLGALVARRGAAPARQETHPLTVLALCDTVEELEEGRARLASYARRLSDSPVPVEAHVGETLRALLSEPAQERRRAASPTSRATTSAT